MGETQIQNEEKEKTGPKGPFKLTKETIKKLEEVFALDGSIGEACFYANITTQTYYNWIQHWPKLKQRFDSLREKPVLKARNTVVGALGDPVYALKYLERKKKSEFSLRTEITGPDGKEIEGVKVNIIKGNQDVSKLESDNGVRAELPSDGKNSD